MTVNIYYFDKEAKLFVTSIEGEHFHWFLKNKMNIDQDQYQQMDEGEKDYISGTYIAEYIPR